MASADTTPGPPARTRRHRPGDADGRDLVHRGGRRAPRRERRAGVHDRGRFCTGGRHSSWSLRHVPPTSCRVSSTGPPTRGSAKRCPSSAAVFCGRSGCITSIQTTSFAATSWTATATSPCSTHRSCWRRCSCRSRPSGGAALSLALMTFAGDLAADESGPSVGAHAGAAAAVRWLQRRGIILSGDDHARHHRRAVCRQLLHRDRLVQPLAVGDRASFRACERSHHTDLGSRAAGRRAHVPGAMVTRLLVAGVRERLAERRGVRRARRDRTCRRFLFSLPVAADRSRVAGPVPGARHPCAPAPRPRLVVHRRRHQRLSPPPEDSGDDGHRPHARRGAARRLTGADRRRAAERDRFSASTGSCSI